MQGMERRIQGRDIELSGPLHVTMPAPFMPVLARDLAGFAREYPAIELTVAAGQGLVDLAHRESDVALGSRRVPRRSSSGVGSRTSPSGSTLPRATSRGAARTRPREARFHRLGRGARAHRLRSLDGRERAER